MPVRNAYKQIIMDYAVGELPILQQMLRVGTFAVYTARRGHPDDEILGTHQTETRVHISFCRCPLLYK